LKTPLGKLSADGMFLTVAPSGIGKTLPMIRAHRISRNLGIIIPSKFTTESLAQYFYAKNDEGYLHNNYGIIFWDEASKYFSESANKKYLDGIIEAMSSIYNHLIPTEYYKTTESGQPQDPYVSMIGNMVPQYLDKIPEYFWFQGLAGRITWRYIIPNKPKPEGSWLEFKISDTSSKNLYQFEEILKNIKNSIDGLERPIIVHVSEEADKLIQDFRYDIEMDWYNQYLTNPIDIRYAYKKRMTELLGKTSLRIALGRFIGEKDTLKGFDSIGKEDVILGLKIIKQSNDDLHQIFDFIELAQTPKEVMLRENKIKAIKRYFKAGLTKNEVQQRVQSYASNEPFDKLMSYLLQTKQIRMKNDSGQFEVLE
jgi:hypothetical protein